MIELLRQPFSKKIYSFGPSISPGRRLLTGLYAVLFILVMLTILTSERPDTSSLIVVGIIFIVSIRVVLGNGKGRKIIDSRSYIGHSLAAGSQFGGCILMNEVGDANYQTDLVATGYGWQIYDMTYLPVYSKGSEIRCSTVFEAELVRITPHLVFDAKRARGRQLRTYYIDEQRLSFEGEFDRFFDVYAPEHYETDTLTFVSPEVMQSFMELKDYDAELIHGRLLVYGPLLDEIELAAFQAAFQELTKQLNDNLSRYRDSYLPSRAANTQIMPFARLLLTNPWQHSVGLIGSVTIFIALLWVAVATPGGQKMIVIVMLAFLFCIPFVARLLGTVIRNRRLKKSFYSDLAAIQDRGRY
jgi:hypothetical protein